MTTRRALLKGAAFGAGAVALAGWPFAFAGDGSLSLFGQSSGSLFDAVAAACERLAALGWRQMLLDATGGELDIGAADLRIQLLKPLARIDRSCPGFGDFNVAGTRAIEPGNPDRSLIYHAFASPTVVADRRGTELGGFPTLAEIDAVENYVYGVVPPTMDGLRARAGGRPLGMVVFALEYRNTPNSVHGRHAELVFSRTGIARLGTIEPLYNAKTRSFEGLDSDKPFDFRVVPQRFAACLAAQMKGDKHSFGPQDAVVGDEKRPYPAGDKCPGDNELDFWVPIHKLFSGRECIAGLDLALALVRDLRNDEIAQFHRYLDTNGYENNWRGEALENFPFVIRNDKIASISTRPTFGPGVVEPHPAPLALVAEYQGKPLTFPVDPTFTGDPSNLEFSSMQIIPGEATTIPSYMYDTSQETQRPAPEYLNVRHRVLSTGKIDNLNQRPDMMEIIRRGNYQTQHYYDLTADGWIEAKCPALEAAIDARVAAYCMVGPPDFFPNVGQRDLMLWWQNAVPKTIRDALWAIPPLALSQTRIAANITLPIGFSINDITITSIVTQPDSGGGPVQAPNGPMRPSLTGLPDTSPGLFDPGWDTSQGIYYSDPANFDPKADLPLQKFLVGYGLGSPFVEDAKLCAALGAYWPGVSPDATRTFQPNKMLSGISYPWPTIVPMTDEEIGIVPVARNKYMPWDGVRGPVAKDVHGRTVAAYTDAMRTDYLDILGTMTAALTARVDFEEYKARVLGMEAVYWSLGIRDPEIMKHAKSHEEGLIKIMKEKSKWAVLSFRAAASAEPELAEAERATHAKFSGAHLYRFDVFRWGKQTTDPDNIYMVYVEMLERAIAYVDGTSVLIRRGSGPWKLDTSMPTS